MLSKTEISDLEETLKAEGFVIAASERAAIYEILAHRADGFRSQDRLSTVGHLVGPLVCHTREEQQRFVGLFRRWRRRKERSTASVQAVAPVVGRPEPKREQLQPTTSSVLPSKWVSILGCVALVAAMFALSFSVDGFKVSRPLTDTQWTKPDQLGGSGQGHPFRGSKIRNSDGTGVLRLLALLAPVIVFAFWLHWRLWARRVVKSRFPTDDDPGLNRFVGNRGESDRLFPVRALTALREFRLATGRGAQGIDVARSVEATARAGGRVELVPRSVGEQHRYIVLIEARAENDHAAHLARAFTARMQELEIEMDIYAFIGSPASVVSAQGRQGWITLEGLSKRHSAQGGVRVLVFGEPECAVDPLDWTVQPWASDLAESHLCTLLPMRPHGELGSRLARAGWIVVPRSLDGLSRLPGIFATGGEAPRLEEVHEVTVDPARWRHCGDGARRQVEALLEEWLDLDGRVWLGSLAVYPKLAFGLTSHLGAELALRNDKVTFDEKRLHKLAQLEWMRHGALPDGVRAWLLDGLSSAQRRVVRRLLYESLGSVLLDRPMPKGGAARLEKQARQLVRVFLRTRLDGDPVADRLSTRFLLFPRWGQAFAAFPDRLARILGFRVDAVPLVAVLLTIAAVLGCGWLVDFLEANWPAFNAWVVERRMWVGITLYVLTLATWSGFWTSVMLSPRFEKFTNELWRRRVRIDALPMAGRAER